MYGNGKLVDAIKITSDDNKDLYSRLNTQVVNIELGMSNLNEDQKKTQHVEVDLSGHATLA